MKKIAEMMKGINLQRVMSWVLFAFAVAAGGGAMAVEIGDEGPNANTSEAPGTAADGANSNDAGDPAHPDANDRLAPGGNEYGQDLTGTQASATQVRKGGLADDEWDNELVQFRPWNAPLISLVRKVAKTYTVAGYERKHMRNGGDTLECTTTAKINGGGYTVDLTPANVNGNMRPFYKGTKIYCIGVPGYKDGSQNELEGTLTLYVTETSKDFKTITVAALNGPAETDGVVTDELDCRTVPEIPAGTILSAGNVAMGESQLLVTPENYRPTEHDVYLSKHGWNIVFTEDYEKIKKKQPLKVADIKADTIVKHNIRSERDYWLSPKRRWNVTNEDGSIEYAYSSEGILNQIVNSMAIEEYSLPVMSAISQLQFTEFSEHDTAFAFCGKNAINKLQHMELPKGHVNVLSSVKEFDISFSRYKDTFGQIDYVYCPSLDMLHMENCIVVIDLKGLVRYIKEREKERTNDMSKGAGEIRSAKRIIHTEADCLALRGYNSIIIGPASEIYNLNLGANLDEIVWADALPANPSKNDKVALAVDYTAGDAEYEAGTVLIYTGSAWEKYKGVDIA